MKRRTSNAVKALLISVTLIPAWAQATAEMYFIHTDLGTPQVMTDDTGSEVWRASYRPFGELASVEGSADLALRFPGQYEDPETGYYYNYFRDYDPSLGRYVQSDPRGIMVDFSNPQREVVAQTGLSAAKYGHVNYLNHMYGYSGQNPLMYTDPTGESPYRFYKIFKKFYEDLDFEGMKPNKKGDGGRICQIRYKKKPIFRLEMHPLDPTDRTPVPHWHMAPDMKEHRKLPKLLEDWVRNRF